MYFPGNLGGESGVELWRTDGTEAGTFITRDIFPGPVSGYDGHLVVVGNDVLFAGRDPDGDAVALAQQRLQRRDRAGALDINIAGRPTLGGSA